MRPPFFAFYPNDFAGDINVEAMCTRAVGAYILLLCKAWQSDPPGSLPNNDQILARLARLDAADWAEVSAGVLACFELRADGRWHQPRLRAEYDRAIAVMKAKRKGGQKGAEVTNARRDGATGKPSGIPAGSPAADPPRLPASLPGEIGDRRSEKKEEKTPPPPAKPGGDGGGFVIEFIDTNQWPAFSTAWSAALLPGAGKVQRTSNRVGLLQQRLADGDWRARWPEALARAGKSAKLRGLDPSWPSGLRLDTFLKDPDMLVRILEGEFDDAPAGGPAPADAKAAEARRAFDAQVAADKAKKGKAA